MESLKGIINKLPEYEAKAKQTDELIQKIALIVAQNQIILKKIGEDVDQLLEDLHNYVEMEIEKEKKPMLRE